ncbi:MAG: dTMP kinase [Mogibacterium sp.]|nr:dTMP kinase [Mogibacterium sp.]
MKASDKKGLFITLEGGDGAGKSTQIRNIESFFAERGMLVLHTREPGGTPIGEKLRDILLDRENGEMDAVTEMLIYAASRAQHVREVIIPALERGEVVICDRFTDSSVAYQGFGRKLGDVVEKVNREATGGLEPDITFWLDIDPEAGRARAARAGEPDRLEKEALEFHYRLYEGYKALAAKYPERIKRIDASETPEAMAEKICEYLEALCTDRQLAEDL